MLFVHEVHQVAGASEDDFESAFRDELMPALGEGPDARLLWYLRQAHGTGCAYTVVTVIGLRDATAWWSLASRLDSGDLSSWSRRVDAMRHECQGKVLVPLDWSPLQEVDLSAVPTSATEHQPSLYMEDTAWPYRGRYEDYLDKSGTLYANTVRRSKAAGTGILEIEASFRPAFGTHRRREVVLWQRIASSDALMRLLTTETPAEYKVPGTWMHDALEVRDRWESRLLRTTSWSPRY